MNICIHLQSDSELITYEGMALALVLASFDHYVQLWIQKYALDVMLNPTSRLHGMAKSAPLYDLPMLWIDDWDKLQQHYNPDLLGVSCPTPDIRSVVFDSYLVF